MNILYSTGCPRCKVLKEKLDTAGVQYEVCTDKDKMLILGFSSVPMFQYDDTIMNFKETVEWLNKQGE